MEALRTLSRIPEKYQDNPVFFKGGGSEEGRYVPEEDYWKKYYAHPDFNYEWKNGYLEEKPVADYMSYLMYKWFLKLLDQFLTVRPIAQMTGLEIGFRLELPGDVSIRKPDMAVVLNDNPVMLHLTDRNYSGTFDMCVESLSYSTLKEIKRDTFDKKKEYQGIGVREYYVLDSRKTETVFYRLNRKGKYEKIKPVGKDIIRSEVLPGFRFRISDLYHQPSLEELTEDEVYQEYVLPFHQEVRHKAELAEKRAEQESQRAEQEKQRAEFAESQLLSERRKSALLSQKLRELGIDPE